MKELMYEENYEHEIFELEGKTFVKIKYTKEKKDKETGKVVLYSEGYEIYNQEEAERVLSQQKQSTQSLKDTKIEKIVLSGEEVRIKKAIARINKANAYQQKAEQTGQESAEKLIENQKEDLKKAEDYVRLWQTIVNELKKKGRDYIG